MDGCLLCPSGTQCRGYILHGLVLKMFSALERGGDASAVGQALGREDRLLLARLGEQAERSCWTRAFVLTVARKLADFVAEGQSDDELRLSVDGLFMLMDGLFGRLPNGIALDLADLAMDVYNQACADLEALDGEGFLPASIVAQGYAAFLRRRSESLGQRGS